MRNFAPDDAAVSQTFATSVRGAFEEDRVVLKAVHRGMANKRTPHLDLKIDVGPLRFRRTLERMIAEEQTLQAAAE
jgi:vanillate O-demethylase monooxygenase subunit